MNKIQELINRLCPEGVEYKELGELEEKEMLKIGRGSIISKKDIRDMPGDFPVYSSSAIGDGEIGRYGKYMFDDERITWSIDGGGKFFYRNNLKYSVTNVSGWIKVLNTDFINTKFLYYVLINSWQKQEYNYTKKAHPTVIKKEYSIPVPPMEVQSEIVRILDNFTLYSAEISAELKARKKQYQYYVEKLLNDASNGNYIRLGDITKLITKGTTPKNFTTSGINYIKTEAFDGVNINKNKLSFVDEETHTTILKRSILEENDILFTIAGATIGKLAIVNKEILPANTNQALAIIRLKDNKNLDYIKYILQSFLMKEYMEKCVRGSAQPNLNLTQLKDFVLPFPSLEKQEEVLKLLEKIDKLVNSVIMGLPAEIEARQKQYEYYRDKLLDFKRLENK